MTGKDLFAAFLEMFAENRTSIMLSLSSAVSKFLYITLRSKRKGSLKERIISFLLALFVGTIAGVISEKAIGGWIAYLITSISAIASDSIIEYVMLKVTAKEIEENVDKVRDKFLK